MPLVCNMSVEERFLRIGFKVKDNLLAQPLTYSQSILKIIHFFLLTASKKLYLPWSRARPTLLKYFLKIGHFEPRDDPDRYQLKVFLLSNGLWGCPPIAGCFVEISKFPPTQNLISKSWRPLIPSMNVYLGKLGRYLDLGDIINQPLDVPPNISTIYKKMAQNFKNGVFRCWYVID